MYFLLIYPPLPGNCRHEGKLTHISHRKVVIICAVAIFLPSELAASAPSIPPPTSPQRVEQLRIARLIQGDSPKSQVQPPIHGNLALVNTYYAEQSAAEGNTSRIAVDAVKRTTIPPIAIIGLWTDRLSGSLPGRLHLWLLNRLCDHYS